MKKFVSIIQNKYFISSLFFLVWMLFFDRNDLFSQLKYRNQVNKLKEEKEFYTKEIEKTQLELVELTSNQQRLEKFAREKYLMKRDNEDVFVIVQKDIQN